MSAPSSATSEPPAKRQKTTPSPSPERQHQAEGEKEEVINFQPLNQKPNFKFQPSALASSLPSFLEEFKRKNEALALDENGGKGFEILDGSSVDEANDDDGESSEDESDYEMSRSEEGGDENDDKASFKKVHEVDASSSSKQTKDASFRNTEEDSGQTRRKKKRKVYIEMELGLGVLEEKAVGSAGEGDQSESSDEESSSTSDDDSHSSGDEDGPTTKS